MTVSMSAYLNLRNNVVSRCTPCMDEDLQRLKDNFKDIIYSTRRMNNIRNIGELVSLLEKRNALNIRNLNCLKDIARLLNQHDLLQSLNSGLQHIVNVQPPAPTQRQPHVQGARVLSPPSAIYHERIYQLIIDQIGHRWKDLARNLRIGEGKIDELADRYRSEPSERIREILKYHEENSPSQEVWIQLLEALNRSRRNDLRIEVQRILIGN